MCRNSRTSKLALSKLHIGSQLCKTVLVMQRVRARLTQDREEEIKGMAKMVYNDRQAAGRQQGQADGFADWVEAENRVIRSTFERQTGCTLSLTNSIQVGL